MAVSESRSSTEEYSITWKSKPLGFSIVMDTTGRNAYVSSIQKQENLQKGLKLAAQIIRINGEDAKQKKHGAILELIKKATLPMTLTFQPRSFATGAGENNEEDEEAKNKTPLTLLIGNAPESARNRVDGLFKLCKDEINGAHMWQRDDQEADPIILWYWPMTGGEKGDGVSGMQDDLWMISRKSQLQSQNAYACCPSNAENPLDIKSKWKVWDKNKGDFVECALALADREVNPTQSQLNQN